MYTAFMGFAHFSTAMVNGWVDTYVTDTYMQAVYHGTIVGVIHLGQYFS